MFFTLCSCSLPEVTVEKNEKRALDAGAGFSQSSLDHGGFMQKAGGNSYLATVHMQLSSSGTPVNFDIHRQRGDLISVNMQETGRTSTYLHMGYTHSEGGIAGLRFTFRF